jgi:hypothetical protein
MKTCARCGGEIPFNTNRTDGYHNRVEDCVAYQAKRIDQLEKKLADVCKAISSVEATAEMLNAVVGRLL